MIFSNFSCIWSDGRMVGQGQSQGKWRAEGGHWADDEGQWRTADGEKFLLRFSTAGLNQLRLVYYKLLSLYYFMKQNITKSLVKL